MLDFADLEGIARELLSFGDTPIAIARGLRVPIYSVPCQVERAHTATLNGSRIISVRASIVDKRFDISHELGHIGLFRAGIVEHHEDWADYIAAAILCPSPSREWEKQASCLKLSQTLVALRWSECTGEPLAVMSPSKVRARWSEHPESHLRNIARRPPPGVAVVRLTDDARRLAILLA